MSSPNKYQSRVEKLSDDDLKSLNIWLLERYGRGYFTGGIRAAEHPDALWRIVWSNDQFEKRFGRFRDIHKGSNILIREVEEVRLVPKYGWIQDRYILEKNVFAPDPTGCLIETLHAPHYEIVWCFQNAETKEPQPIIRKGVEFLIDCLTSGAIEAAKNLFYSQSMEKSMASEDQKQQDSEQASIADELNQEFTPLQSALADGAAVVKGSPKLD